MSQGLKIRFYRGLSGNRQFQTGRGTTLMSRFSPILFYKKKKDGERQLSFSPLHVLL